MKRGAAFTVTTLAALLAWSCAGPVPPVPAVTLEGMDTEVRAVVQAAHQQAAAQPSSGQASGRLGMVLHAHSLYQPAMLSYQRAIRLEPKEFAWRYYLALVLQQISQPDKALEAFSAALRIRPDYAPAVLRRGDLLFQMGRFQESAAAYESVLAKDPASADALYGLGRVRYAQHDMSAAEDLYRRASQAYPKFGAAYYGLAMAGRSLGHDADSAKNFELSKRFTGDHPSTSDPLLSQMGALTTGVFRRFEQANSLAKQGDMEEAARLNEEVLARDPDNLSALLNLLYLARFLNRFDNQVDTLYSRAQRIDPRVPLIYDYYGVVMVREGKYEAAMAALRKALDLRPNYAEPHKWMGEVLERQNQIAGAIENYQLALAAEPSDRATQMKLWWDLIIQGRGREAIPQLIPAIQIDDMFTPMRLVLLGEAYRTTGEFGKSRQYLEQARSRVRNQGPPDLLAQIEHELKELPQP
ncbi:MAG TPA: tetratricopeptide repeat protein [Bryobacteraceae bacterium]|nr:tetratricopeptide repeat protein [Bryobacteraceae bacterium]